MARIAGTQIPVEKKVNVALTYVFGVGPTLSKKILDQAKVDGDIRVKDLTNQQLDAIRNVVDGGYNVEGNLRQQVSNNIKRLKEIGSYRGERHAKRLPARGQRTKTNARTKRGKRVTVGTNKPKPQKT